MKFFKIISIGLLVLSTARVVQAQTNNLNQTVMVDNDQPLIDVLLDLEKKTALRFYFFHDWIDHLTVKKTLSGTPLHELLTDLLEGSEVGYVYMYDYAVIFYKNPVAERTRREIVNSARKRNLKVESIVIGQKSSANEGSHITLNGKVIDQQTKRALPGVSVKIDNSNMGTSTNAAGEYQFEIKAGEHVLTYQLVGYEEGVQQISIYTAGSVLFEMDEAPTTLDEVVIQDKRIVERSVGQTSISIQDLSRAPAFLGQPDIIKGLQVQAGITTVSEASSGFNVRGGGVDQNLILFDGVSIFNSSHALGFFTAFNSNSVKEATLFKGGIPAIYGGRVSSVLDISSIEGNYNRWTGKVGAGLIAADISADGPIKNDTSSLAVSLRTTYSDWALNLLQNQYSGIEKSLVAFSDGSFKYAHKLKSGAKLTWSGYVSRDKFQLATDTINFWSNMATNVRYDNMAGAKTYYSITLSLGRYAFKISEYDPATAFRLSYQILYPGFSMDFNRDGTHKIAYGFQSMYYNFNPGTLQPLTTESNSKTIDMSNESSIESAFYFSDSFQPFERINVDAGIRLPVFTRLGPGIQYQYEAGLPREPRNIIDSVKYNSGEWMKTYTGVEPRLSVRYLLNRTSSVKAGYNRINQFLHLITNTAAVTPVDIWQSSNSFFKPQVADQVSLGYFWNTTSTRWHGYIEGYYKTISNILDFKDGANLILNPRLETALIQGKGKSYGVEVSVSKLQGRLQGEFNYTYSRSLRLLNGTFENERINNGNWYAANFDQPHVLNLNWRYTLGRKVFFSGIFTYHTGRPISMPIAAYDIDYNPIIDFSDRNNYRLPDYHRLDLALIVEGSNKKQKFKGEWTISIYNVYGRKNPYSAFFDYNVAGSVRSNQIALIGIPVPSVTYAIKF
ncbi:MAG: TonB-dependent receptor [Cyclobacteriaceae bacterium]|nr:TonB-dependent receptor [Cyclobacteriaceae bacterium]